MLEARKYNRNRIILFVAFSLLTLGLCLYCTMAVNGSLKCSDFGNFRCSVFGSNTTVDSATMVQ